jgi:hypothetical protein
LKPEEAIGPRETDGLNWETTPLRSAFCGQSGVKVFGVHTRCGPSTLVILGPFGPYTLMNWALVGRPASAKRRVPAIALDLDCVRFGFEAFLAFSVFMA